MQQRLRVGHEEAAYSVQGNRFEQFHKRGSGSLPRITVSSEINELPGNGSTILSCRSLE